MNNLGSTWALSVAALATLSACAGGGSGTAHSPEIVEGATSFSLAQSAQLRPYAKALYLDGERNAVLNFSRLGLAALEFGAV